MNIDDLARTNIRRVRERIGVSLEKLASQTAIHRNTLNNIETGATKHLKLDHVVRIAAALGVAPIHLLVPWTDDETLHMPTRHRIAQPGSPRYPEGTSRPKAHVEWGGPEAYAWFTGTLKLDPGVRWFVSPADGPDDVGPSVYYGVRPPWRWTEEQVQAFTEGDG